MNPPLLMIYALLAGVVYFCCMDVVHYFGITQPVPGELLRVLGSRLHINMRLLHLSYQSLVVHW
jgi:hypothetical protein